MNNLVGYEIQTLRFVADPKNTPAPHGGAAFNTAIEVLHNRGLIHDRRRPQITRKGKLYLQTLELVDAAP